MVRNHSALRVTLRVVSTQSQLLERSHCQWESSVGPELSSIYNKMIDSDICIVARRLGHRSRQPLAVLKPSVPRVPRKLDGGTRALLVVRAGSGAARTTQPAN